MKLHRAWLPENERLALLKWVDAALVAGVLKKDQFGARSIQFRNEPRNYLLIGMPLERIKDCVRREFGLQDHRDAEPGYKVWVSVMHEGCELPIHGHSLRPGFGDLRVNMLLKAADEGGKVGYVDREYDVAQGDLWFLDGVKPHWVTSVTKGTRILLSFGFDVPQEKCDAY